MQQLRLIKLRPARPLSRPARSRRAGESERGDLAVVIAVFAVVLLVLIPIAAYASSTNLLPLSRGNQDYQNALAAAEAGVADYVNHLNQAAANGINYAAYGNNPPASAPNPAFTSWVNIPQATNGSASSEYFTYSINPTGSTTGGPLLTSTGIALHGYNGAQTYSRSVQVALNIKGYPTYPLLTNTNVMAPSLGYVATGTSTPYYCLYQYGQTTTNPVSSAYPNGDPPNGIFNTTYINNNDCAPYLFDLNNVPNGSTNFLPDIYTNDVYYLNNANNISTPLYSSNSGCATGILYITNNSSTAKCPTHTGNNPPTTAPVVSWPAGTINSGAGCTYYGPTYVIFGSYPFPSSPTGTPTPTLNIYSPETASTATCPTGTNLPLGTYPDLAEITVKAPPSGDALACTTSVQIPATSTAIPAVFANAANSYSYPCSHADAIVQGQETGNITVYAQNNLIINGNTYYTSCANPSNTSDVLGLVAGQNIEVANTTWTSTPVNTYCQGATWLPSSVHSNDAVLMGALMAINGSFTFQDPTCSASGGKLGTLYFVGSIAQNYGGIDGLPSSATNCGSSFNMHFYYDSRLTTLSPLGFPIPPNATWKEARFQEVPAPTPLPYALP